MAEITQVNLLDYSEAALSEWFASQGQPRFRVKQLVHWIHHEGVTDFSAMTNFSQALRDELSAHFYCRWPSLKASHVSADGTVKLLLTLNDGNAIETVLIPQGKRLTVCVSSQVGCALNCSFCATGRAGFNRDCSLSEIIGQVWLARDYLNQHVMAGGAVTNVVMMGMGEPLLNYDTMLQAVRWMIADHAYGLSKYRVTVSTSGVLPAMRRLQADCDVALAVSLHAATDHLRDQLVPINKKYPLADLIDLCRTYYHRQPKRYVTMEYIMLAGVNDQPKDAKALIRLLSQVRCKINLIPFNPVPGLDYRASTELVVARFQHQLMQAGFNTLVRRQRGDELAAACGQLAGAFDDRTGRRDRLARIPVRVELKDEGEVA